MFELFSFPEFCNIEEPYKEHLRLYENTISLINTNLELDQF